MIELVPVDWSPVCTRCQGITYEYIKRQSFKEPGKQRVSLSLIECVWCGQTTFTEWKPSSSKPISERFRFMSGRFSGDTVEEVAAKDNGLQYLEMIETGSLEVTDECKKAVSEFFNRPV